MTRTVLALPLLLLSAPLWTACSAVPRPSPAAPGLLAESPFQGQRYALSVRALAYEDYEQSAEGLGDESVDGETDVKGWGLEAELVGSGGPAVVFGWTQREYGNDQEADADEVHLGLKFYLGSDRIVPYGIANLRYSEGLEFSPELAPAFQTQDYFGFAAGFGAVFLVDASFFIDVRVQYEDLLDDIELGSGLGDAGLSGWVGSIGAGFSF